MSKKFNIATLMLATSLAFVACSNKNSEDTDTKENTAVEEKADETKDTAEKSKKDEKTEVEETTDDDKDKLEENNMDEESEEKDKEETDDSDESSMDGNVVLHRAYPDEASRSFTNVVVATSGDKIVNAFIDEYQYFDEDENYQGVPNSDKDFVKGKTITELEEFLDENEDEKIIDSLSGATFKSTPSLLRYVVDAAKDDSYVIEGNADNPEDIELRYALGAPHGDKSFANAVIAVEGDKIIAASIDEYQYIEEGITKQGENSDFAKDYADSKTVLASKLENNDLYSDLMKEKAKSTTSIKDNFEAIENFVAGKTIDEVKETISNAKEGEAIETVSGATLVDTAGSLQLIVDAAENAINK